MCVRMFINFTKKDVKKVPRIVPFQLGIIKSRFHDSKNQNLTCSWFLEFLTCRTLIYSFHYTKNASKIARTNMGASWKMSFWEIRESFLGDVWKCLRCSLNFRYLLFYFFRGDGHQKKEDPCETLQNIEYGFHIYQNHAITIWQLFPFQTRKSPVPLSIPTPTPASNQGGPIAFLVPVW